MSKIITKAFSGEISNRAEKYLNDKITTAVIFTAFRNDINYEDNIKNNKLCAAELKKNKFGYFYVEGYFPENEGTDNEVKEEFIFAIANANRGQNLISLAHKLANFANQDSIIVKDAKTGKLFFLNKNNDKNHIESKSNASDLGKYYSKLRNKRDTNAFVFENEKDGDNFFTSYLKHIINAEKTNITPATNLSSNASQVTQRRSINILI